MKIMLPLVLLSFLSACAPNLQPAPQPASQSTTGAESMQRSSIPAPRPGLATGWGDEKKSNITFQNFVRSSSKPVGTDAIFYNDANGVAAMMHSLERVDAMQIAAGGLVEWGIKAPFGFFPAYKDFGMGRRLVAGRKASAYSIVIKNRSLSPLEIVASVDGLDVMDGKPATFRKRGYIIQPSDTLEIKGFRTSDSSVAAFKFSSVSNSYANMRHGNTQNVGVIGIAVFSAKDSTPWQSRDQELKRRNQAKPFAEAPSP